MNNLQPIFNIAEICAQKQVRNFILSPGSRCAPLTISMVRHPDISTKTISDERSAAFIAMGMAQNTGNTVGLICTSGSAAYNYAPAIAEAYYQQIPLLVLTADRPQEWIDQLDGQTIRQNQIYGTHVKHSYTLPSELSHPDTQWHINRILSEAINLSQEFPKGPVHINLPLREPFYPDNDIVFDKNTRVISEIKGTTILSESQWSRLKEEFSSYSKVLIVAGQSELNNDQSSFLNSIATHLHIPVIGDCISNISGDQLIFNHDAILSCKDAEALQNLQPEILITFGKSLISKSLKTFLRNSKLKAHWHIQEAGYVADTFQAMTKTIRLTPDNFFSHINSESWSIDASFSESWKKAQEESANKVDQYCAQESSFTEFIALQKVVKALPSDSLLHLANSMPVRYVNYLTPKEGFNTIEVFANRGTSGIDGTVSTAYGAAFTTDQLVTVITGDLAFFYDRNAWWNNYPPSNLRVILLNNHGGGIFRIIDGPSKQPELDEYFETKQTLVAENTAKDFDILYTRCNSKESLEKALINFFEKSDKPKILEIETDSKINTEYFKNFKKYIS